MIFPTCRSFEAIPKDLKMCIYFRRGLAACGMLRSKRWNEVFGNGCVWVKVARMFAEKSARPHIS